MKIVHSCQAHDHLYDPCLWTCLRCNHHDNCRDLTRFVHWTCSEFVNLVNVTWTRDIRSPKTCGVYIELVMSMVPRVVVVNLITRFNGSTWVERNNLFQVTQVCHAKQVHASTHAINPIDSLVPDGPGKPLKQMHVSVLNLS